MASSLDFEKIHSLYQSDGIKRGLSIVQFCQQNGIVYSHYERWYKTERAHRIVPVEIVDKDGLQQPCSPSQAAPSALSVSASIREGSDVSRIEIYFGNGLQVIKEDLTYPSLVQLVNKLEVLC